MSENKKRIIVNGVLHKQCAICHKYYPLNSSYFQKQSSSSDGFQYACKECRNFHQRGDKPVVKKMPSKSTEEGYKVCTQCGKKLPATTEYFQKSKRGKYGLFAKCKECMKEYRTINTEHIKEVRKRDTYNNRFRYREKTRKWRINNLEKCKEVMKVYYQTHKNNSDFKLKRSITSNRYNYKKKQLVSTLTTEDWNECLKFFNYKDAYTGLPMDIVSQDHVTPVSKCGGYTKQNIVPCEASINASKGNRPLEKWYKQQPFYDEKRLEIIYKWIGMKNNMQQLALI